MAISRDIVDQLRHLLRPIAMRVANTVARGVVQLVDDDKKLQLIQLGVLAGETIDGAEYHQPYGFTSVPLAGAEAVVLFPGGDRAHPLVVAVSDRRHRPVGGEPGQVTMRHYLGAEVTMLEDGTVEVRSESGTATKLPTLADYNALRAAFNSHTHVVSTTGTAAAQTGTAAAVIAPVGSPTGTSVLKAE
jgi:phage baseplate assembly protein V